MTNYSMNVVLEGYKNRYEVEYTVTSEGSGPSGEVFDGTADPGDPVELYLVSINEQAPDKFDAALVERIEAYVYEHHEPDTSSWEDDYYDYD